MDNKGSPAAARCADAAARALVLILVKDRDFWFPLRQCCSQKSEPIEEVVPAPNAKSEVAGGTTQQLLWLR